MELENSANSLIMTGLENDAEFEIRYGDEKRKQQLNMLRSDALKKHYEKNISRKEDKAFWWKFGFDTASKTASTIGAFLP